MVENNDTYVFGISSFGPYLNSPYLLPSPHIYWHSSHTLLHKLCAKNSGTLIIQGIVNIKSSCRKALKEARYQYTETGIWSNFCALCKTCFFLMAIADQNLFQTYTLKEDYGYQ
jgi:hypothetical protein